MIELHLNTEAITSEDIERIANSEVVSRALKSAEFKRLEFIVIVLSGRFHSIHLKAVCFLSSLVRIHQVRFEFSI